VAVAVVATPRFVQVRVMTCWFPCGKYARCTCTNQSPNHLKKYLTSLSTFYRSIHLSPTSALLNTGTLNGTACSISSRSINANSSA
jgi:hypothetical protein